MNLRVTKNNYASNKTTIVDIMDKCLQLDSMLDLGEFIKNDFASVVQNDMAMFGIVELPSFKLISFNNLGYPKSFINNIIEQNPVGEYVIVWPFIRQWAQEKKTLCTHELSNISLGSNLPSNKTSFIYTGLHGITGERASFFGFSGNFSNSIDQTIELVDLALPSLHRALIDQHLKSTSKKERINKQILTKREMGIIRFIYQGFGYKEIAQKEEISINTVRSHMQNILLKLRVSNKTQALAKAFKLGLL